MAAVSPKQTCQMRPPNKEPEWSNLCASVFDQYLDGDDLFAIEGGERERTSSDGSADLFDFSGSSEQSHQTNATSPVPSLEEPFSIVESIETEAQQPKARAPGDFWTRKLRALEQNAAECEQRQQKLRSTKSYGDFLSLGGHPSPPALPGSPTNQSLSVRRQRSRPAANGRKTPTQRNVTNTRSVSRGRPAGVTKQPPTSAAAKPYASTRSRSRNVSPSKMMNPSRYRAGFKDVWAERIQNSPKKYELRLPPYSAFPDSPPPSARSAQDAFAAFGSPISYCAPVPGCDDQISPLASTFQNAAIHTPPSPLLAPDGHASSSYFEAAPPLPTNAYAPQTVPLNDTAPFFPENNTHLAANRIQSFDFGFSSSPAQETWGPRTSSFPDPPPALALENPFDNQDPFAGLDDHSYGLGISCDPSLVNNENYANVQDNTLLPMTYQPTTSAITSPFYTANCAHGLPISRPRNNIRRPSETPSRRRISHSPSPPPSQSRRASSSRRASRHRRNKSGGLGTSPPKSAAGAGFVNFTPQDSNKILSGVAPSGSSKTKARREKEAADRRRRLSQAAMRAVMEAGGNVDALERAGWTAGIGAEGE